MTPLRREKEKTTTLKVRLIKLLNRIAANILTKTSHQQKTLNLRARRSIGM